MRLARFPMTRMPDGRAMANVGCGYRTRAGWTNIDFSWYARLAHRPGLSRVLHHLGVLSQDRDERLQGVDPAIVVADLRRGIPFPDNAFDVVYSSHFVEHLERGHAAAHLREQYRVLKPGGVVRVVVPDLRLLVERCRESATALDGGDPTRLSDHLASIHALLGHMVQRESFGTTQQRRWVRRLERVVRGGAARTGDLHLWMYDRYSLAALLSDLGFQKISVETPTSSRIEGWSRFHLDTEEDGTVYKRLSLYMEAVK